MAAGSAAIEPWDQYIRPTEAAEKETLPLCLCFKVCECLPVCPIVFYVFNHCNVSGFVRFCAHCWL